LTELEQAQRLCEQGDYVNAEKTYRNILKKNPENAHAYWGMGNLALIAKRPDQAVSYLKKTCQLLPADPMPLIHLAKAYNELHLEQDALVVLEYGVKLMPEFAQMHYDLGQQLLILGNLSKAECCFRAVLPLGHDLLNCYALLEISRLKKFESLDEDAQLLHTYLAKSKQVKSPQIDRQCTVLHYALGKVYDDLQDYPQAWVHFTQANRLQFSKTQFKSNELDAFFLKIKQLNSPEILRVQRDVKANEITPIFILGLPRTGSTLLEQMLCRHNNIAGAGEVPYLSSDLAAYFFGRTQLHYPDYLSTLSQSQLDEAANIYLSRLNQHAQGQQYVINKLPSNFQSIGLIYKLFPNAKVIHLTRNTADVALSIFTNFFAENEPYFCNLHEFKHYHSLYTNLMQQWNCTLPGYIYELSYEQLVNNTESTLRDLLNHCSIQWDDACIDASPQSQTIKTLSNIQVRKPIYRTSTSKWKHYQKYLQVFLD
jgi:tetratricopeptide (TPR) repeat protein